MPAIPPLIYGTAWKGPHTRALVKQALLSGFTAIDTAAQPKHYQEDLVGAGIRDSQIARSNLYIQTKYTSIHGQDLSKGMPYDPQASITEQVHASVASSLRNLRHDDADGESAYLDCLVMHSPFPTMPETREAWRAMESHVPSSVRTLGISNCYDTPVLRELYDLAVVKPAVVQNRFYKHTGYDREIRAFCEEKQIRYQSFWTLTANPSLLRSEPVGVVAQQVGVRRPVALYGLVLGLGNVSVLDGTRNKERMDEDLAAMEAIKKWSESNGKIWQQTQTAFQTLLYRKTQMRH